MAELNSYLQLIDNAIGGSQWFVFLLLGTGLFFTLYLGFPQIRYFGLALKIVRGKFDKKGDEGDTSHFQALATALSGTVGTGNIGGVAYAIHLGGPAALFWMLVTAFLGMTTKFVEVTLSHKYREKTADGTMAGGPMYFMKNAQFKLGSKKVNMKWMAILFAIATVISSFGTGNFPQINNIAGAIESTFGIEPMVVGGVLALLLGIVIVGGIKRIAQVTEKLVPGMAILYFVGCLSVILYNFQNIVPAIGQMMSEVFTGTAAVGGFLGASLAFAFNRGVNRGLFSNEAGQGSAPIAHASARAHEPVSEGMVSILEPFIDTIIICSLTGITLMASGVWSEKFENKFNILDLQVVNGVYYDSNPQMQKELAGHISGADTLPLYNGTIEVINGKMLNPLTFVYSRSIAEEVVLTAPYGSNEDFFGPMDSALLGTMVPYSGAIKINHGVIAGDIPFEASGKSLIHSAPLTSEAFTRGFFGDFGKYIVAIGLLLFAFSTAISWSYYGDRAMTFLLGTKSVPIYRILYVIGFFLASFTDTTLIWTFAGIAIALMTIPNLIGILWLRKEMKSTVTEYIAQLKTDYLEENDTKK